MTIVRFLDAHKRPVEAHLSTYVVMHTHEGVTAETKAVRLDVNLFVHDGYAVLASKAGFDTYYVDDVLYLNAEGTLVSKTTDLRKTQNRDIAFAASSMLLKARSSKQNWLFAFGTGLIFMCWMNTAFMHMINHVINMGIQFGMFMACHALKQAIIAATPALVTGPVCLKPRWDSVAFNKMLHIFCEINIAMHIAASIWFRVSSPFYPIASYWTWICMGAVACTWDLVCFWVY
jgi:hypothetical protein